MMPATHPDNPVTRQRRERFLSRQSVIEMRARERARALLDPGTFRELLGPFDRLESPWLPLQGIVPESDDGVITARTVGPGSFVHDAATAPRAQSLLTVDRLDIVTVYMRVPDVYAPFVTRGTEAVIEMNDLPGEVTHARVTRFAPSLNNPEHDRTMRVEVDLYNGTKQEYERFVAKEAALPAFSACQNWRTSSR